MKSVVRFSLGQAVFLNVVFVVLTVAGAFSLLTTPVENMPPIDIGKVFVRTLYYGASSEDVERLVSAKIEKALDGMENIEYIQSRSRRNYSSVEVKFIDDSDYEDLYDELRLRIQNIQKDLPPETDKSEYLYIDTQAWMPVVIVNLAADIPNHSLKLLSEELKSTIISIPGVREVVLNGEHQQEFHVSLDPVLLRRHGVTFEEASRAVESASVKIPSGRFSTGDTEYMLDAGRMLSSQKQVLDIVVRRDGDGNFILIGDLVTSARISHRDPDFITSVNGYDSMNLFVKKEDSGNAISIMKQITAVVSEFEKTHIKDDVSIALTNDSTIEIRDSINTLGGSMILGMILVTIVLWITLGFRNAMLTAIGIPFSLLCTLIFIKLAGQSINTISLFSFVLVSGIIVDDAVIILENIFRHMQFGKSKVEAIIDGAGEVMLPVISAALTTIFAFMPMLIMTGSTGDFFSVIPKTVSFALAASLIEALFILPVHVFDWGRKSVPHRVEQYENVMAPHLKEGLFAPAWRLYSYLLEILLANPVKTLLAMFTAFIVAVTMIVLSVTGIVPLINIKFFPGSYFRYHVPIVMPPGTSIENTDRVVRDLANFVMELGPKESMATIGTAGMYEAENYTWQPSHNHGQIVVTLPRESEREFPSGSGNDPLLYLDHIRDELKNYVKEKYGQGEGAPRLKVFPENTGPPTGKAVNIRITGDSREMVSVAAEEIMEHLKNDPDFESLTDLEVNRAALQRVARFLVDERAASERGVTPAMITRILAGTLNGTRVGTFLSVDDDMDIVVRLAKSNDPGIGAGRGIRVPADVLDVPVIEHSASPIMLGELVDLSYTTEPSIRMRYNGKPALTVSADLRAGSKLSSSRVQVLVSKFASDFPDKYPGVTVTFGGEFETTSRTFTSLGFAFIISLLCIYLILSSQFKDYLQPLIIISAVMFAVIGVTFGMFLTRSTFTVGSFMALVGLAGVAVNDSLILIDFINVRMRKGAALRDAVLAGCSERMRPVMITTVTTMFGLMPMALGIPRKSIAWQPMATAFVTGLASATMLALLIIPVEYELAERFKAWMKKTGKKLKRDNKTVTHHEN
jgi:HAE1 family hydrophobic/amphiphilic exporter-1